MLPADPTDPVDRAYARSPTEATGRTVLPPSWRQALVLWGVLGVSALVLKALVRLTPVALEPVLDGSLTGAQASLYGAWVVINGYAEGYRGFHLRFSPRVIARAFFVARHGRPIDMLFAPIFCMGLYRANRRVLVSAWCLLVLITLLVLFVRELAQPWRGIIDGGVVVGLGWGLASLALLLGRAFRRQTSLADPQVPGHVA